MESSRTILAAFLIVGLLAANCGAEPEFRLGISGQLAMNDGGFLIESLDPDSPLLTIRDKDGHITSAEPGDRVLTLNQQPFSPDKLQGMQDALVSTNGIVDLSLVDSRTGNTIQFSAVLRRTDVDPELRRGFLTIVRDDYAEVERTEVKISELPTSITGMNLDSALIPRSRGGADSPLSKLVACQAGIDQLRVTAQTNHFEKMIPVGTYTRAESIVQNAVAAASLDPFGEQARATATNAQAAVIDEFRAAFESYARQQNKQWREQKTWAAGFFRFRPVTAPPDMTVEVIPGADIKIILMRDPAKTPNDIDQLSGWTPLPATDASIYGRFFYRVRNPSTGQLMFGYHKDKFIAVNRNPASGEILFP